MLRKLTLFRNSSGQSRDRTGDLRIFSPSLYQLSYLSKVFQNKDLEHSGVSRPRNILALFVSIFNCFSDNSDRALPPKVRLGHCRTRRRERPRRAITPRWAKLGPTPLPHPAFSPGCGIRSPVGRCRRGSVPVGVFRRIVLRLSRGDEDGRSTAPPPSSDLGVREFAVQGDGECRHQQLGYTQQIQSLLAPFVSASLTGKAISGK